MRVFFEMDKEFYEEFKEFKKKHNIKTISPEINNFIKELMKKKEGGGS